MKNISNQNLNFKDKKVLLRVDLNVPMKNGSITELSRIEKIIPTIKLLVEKKAKIITSCAMFYDLENPLSFVKNIEEILDENGVWCCQISYLDSMIRYNNFYDI